MHTHIAEQTCSLLALLAQDLVGLRGQLQRGLSVGHGAVVAARSPALPTPRPAAQQVTRVAPTVTHLVASRRITQVIKFDTRENRMNRV